VTFTWSETVLAPAQGLFVVPPSVDAKTASMLNINPTTAVLLLDEFVQLNPKDWIVLNAANSQVARCLIAIAKSRDLNIVGIVRRSELLPELERLGVDFVGVESPELSKQMQITTSGTDYANKSRRFRHITFANHHNIQTVPNPRSNRTLPAWWQGAIGFQSPKLGPATHASLAMGFLAKDENSGERRIDQLDQATRKSQEVRSCLRSTSCSSGRSATSLRARRGAMRGESSSSTA